MLRRWIFALLATSLLLQHTVALPPPPADSSSSEESKEHEPSTAAATTSATATPAAAVGEAQPEHGAAEGSDWSARNKLLFFTLEEFAVLSNFTVEQGTVVFRGVLRDAALLKERDELLHAHLANISSYVAHAERVAQLPQEDKVAELYDMVVQFTEIVERYNSTAHQQPSTEELYLEASLKKNGLEQLQVNFLERFLGFAQKFNSQIEGYLSALPEQERANEAKMIDWYRQFKNESDGEKKVEIFAKFFELYS